MEINLNKPTFSRSILAALFSGIIATATAQAYDIIYRGITHYNPSFIINVSTIIFATLIPTMVAGLLFYVFTTYIKGGIYIFQALFIILCIALANVALHSNYGGNLPTFQGFKGLLLGVDVIIGIFIILFIPYFFKHYKFFMD